MVVSGEIENSRVPAEDFPAAPEPETPRHLDELSTLGDNTIAEFYQESALATSVMSSQNFSLQPATLADFAGGDRAANAEIIRLLLRGEERGPKRDAVLLNTAAALFVAGRVRSLLEGWDLAGELIDSGTARAKLDELVAASKKSERQWKPPPKNHSGKTRSGSWGRCCWRRCFIFPAGTAPVLSALHV